MKTDISLNYSVSVLRPNDFFPCVEVAACYVACKDRLLLLQRSEGKFEQLTWGVPAGKVEKGESIRQAVVRETFEEVGIQLDNVSLKYLGELYIRKKGGDFIYHMFHQEFTLHPPVTLNSEHRDYLWVTIAEAKALPLIPAGSEALDFFYSRIYLGADKIEN